jgi:hypothetical protein
MSKITCVALLIALSHAATPGQAQNNAVAQSEVASQSRAPKRVFREGPPIDEETRKKLLELGYSTTNNPRSV